MSIFKSLSSVTTVHLKDEYLQKYSCKYQQSTTKLPDFFLENIVTIDQKPNEVYKSLKEDGYNVQEPDLLHKVHPKFWNNAPMLKYLCHNAIYKHRDELAHFKNDLPKFLANSVADFIKTKDWMDELSHWIGGWHSTLQQ